MALCFAVVHGILLYGFYCCVLHGIALYYMALNCITWHCIVSQGIEFYCIALFYILLHCITLYCSIWYCVVSHCIVSYITDPYAFPFVVFGFLRAATEPVLQPAQNVVDGLGSWNDVEGWRNRPSLLKVTHPQTGPSELPLRICIILTE